MSLFILTVFLCVMLCGCDQSLAPKKIDSHDAVTYKVYVSGAIENDGYYTVSAGTTVYEAIEQAGIIAQTFLPSFAGLVIDCDMSIVVEYYENGISRNSINVNDVFIAMRFDIEGLNAEVVDKLATYIEHFGVIANRADLKIALGDDYASNYYKLFIDEKNYEAVS